MKIRMLIKRATPFCMALILVAGIKSYSQETKLLSFGARGGFSLPVLTTDYQPATQYRLAPVAGGFIQAKLQSWLAVTCDILYTQYGGNNINPYTIYYPGSTYLDDLDYLNLKMDCIEVPVALKLGLPNFTGSVSPFLSVGGAVAFCIQASSHNYYHHEIIDNYPILYSATDVVTSSVNTANYSFLIGTGVDFQGDQLNFSFEIYYRIGLSYINYNQRTYSPDYRANAFGVKVGIGL